MDVSNELARHADGVVSDAFGLWFDRAEPQLRAAFLAAFGAELGRDATAEALGYVWEHRDRVLALENPTGYAFRVGQRWARRQRVRRTRKFGMTADAAVGPGFEPGLHAALDRLPTRQRQVVVLCVGYSLTHAEAADLLGISRSTVQNHVERGLRRLREEIGS